MKKTKKRILWHYLYAIYKGDEFIDVGTGKELAQRYGYSSKYIGERCSPSHHKRAQKRQDFDHLTFYRICKEREDGLLYDDEPLREDIEK